MRTPNFTNDGLSNYSDYDQWTADWRKQGATGFTHYTETGTRYVRISFGETWDFSGEFVRRVA